jgi:aminoglycoside phosphotransferase (APT) family kinase protein
MAFVADSIDNFPGAGKAPILRDVLLEFARELYGSRLVAGVEVEPLRGGLEADGISLVQVRGPAGRHLGGFVVKPMCGTATREYRLHAAVQRLGSNVAAPRVLGTRSAGETLYVFMEWIRAFQVWPWTNAEHAALVLGQLAHVHGCRCSETSALADEWNYDEELAESAISTVELYGRLFTGGLRVGGRPMLRPLERICSVVTAMRAQAAAFTDRSLLHGDVHPGNAMLRAREGRIEAVLLDWGRARTGSPLEDVMSWLHSLGFWEPSARRIHDSLLSRYRQARGLPDGLSPDFRAASWIAGACNAMAGALRYHLAVASDEERDPEDRWKSSHAAADWLRIVRRADAVWRA